MVQAACVVQQQAGLAVSHHRRPAQLLVACRDISTLHDCSWVVGGLLRRHASLASPMVKLDHSDQAPAVVKLHLAKRRAAVEEHEALMERLATQDMTRRKVNT
jgi:hypothetical protein